MPTTVDAAPMLYTDHPRFEGANIRTWMGFKHFVYLVEEALLDWFRSQGMAPGTLLDDRGAGIALVDMSVRLPNTLGVDDTAQVEVSPVPGGVAGSYAFKVKMSVARAGADVTVLKGRARAVLLAAVDAPGDQAKAAAGVLADAAEEDATPFQPALDPPFDPAVPDAGGRFCWSWRIPYFYCHHSSRLQHSGYVRALEEVVDRFLADREMSVRKMLDERGWIPVVSRARVQILNDARMEEVLHTVFTVEALLGNATFDGRMDCFVERDGELVQTATASILHGYAGVRGADTGRLATFDDGVRAALLGTGVDQ